MWDQVCPRAPQTRHKGDLKEAFLVGLYKALYEISKYLSAYGGV